MEAVVSELTSETVGAVAIGGGPIVGSATVACAACHRNALLIPGQRSLTNVARFQTVL